MIICSLFIQQTACINIAVGFENQGVCQNSDSMACRRWLEQVLNHVCLSGGPSTALPVPGLKNIKSDKFVIFSFN